MSEGIVRSLGSGRFLDWKAMNAEGVLGGILICWDKVYGPFSKVERDELWEEFEVIRGLWEDPWCLGGDFNITLFQRERSSQRRINLAMRRFAEIVDDLGLVDLPLQGGEFTWNGGHNNQAWARLDKFLVSLAVRGSVSFKLAAKMKEIKQKLKVWNREVFGRLDCNKSSALQQVDLWDRMESERSLTVEETKLKKEAKEITKKSRSMGNGFQRSRRLGKELLMLFISCYQKIRGGRRTLGGFSSIKSVIRMALLWLFWQNRWDFVKEEILEMFKEFHEYSSFLKSLNNTFLVLIPKKSGAEDLGDFRPISLLGGLYKLLAKVLANRLKKVVGNVVSTSQNAFVRGRQILDTSLIANEVIDSWQKRKEKGLICKLDIEKAYDNINWKFLLKVLQKMGFGSKWLGWTWSCLFSAKFSVLVNGVPAGFFLSTKGLRQGDLLSPYLFVMGMEVLDVLIRRAVEGGFLSGSASGLRINLAKSEIIPVGEVEEIEELAVELGCRVGSLPSQYLGLPLGAPNRAPYMWDGVEERVRRRLALWKQQYISKGGRITLIKSTLASMSIYQMSIFRMPKIVARRLEKVQRGFLWGGGNLERKIHLVNWEVVCTDKEKGGLGLRKLAMSNKALLDKWIWRYVCDKDNLWKQVIKVKYGQEGLGWRPKKANGAVGVGVWKEIWKESNWCWDNMIFQAGKGTKIRFWTNVWCTDIVLSHCFPHLFVMAVQRSSTIEEMWDQNSGQGGSNLNFLRDFNDWELDMVGDLLHMLRGHRLSLEEDSVFLEARKKWSVQGQGSLWLVDQS
ncbi:putative ribonuclease H protein [Vitis vinifera]|uniref:Putative ribonuclease H protein n=1 Tax=Vitis vinifera TaxID=29760 RepID=A0A438II72_VITVI|nr:putative ribonuclease H protein [Vitis vinifera]